MDVMEAIYVGGQFVIASLFFILGCTYGRRKNKEDVFKESRVGTLRVDRSDPDGPYLFLELHRPFEDVARQEHVILDVKDEDYISQE